jgi:transcriptional regulator with XRE-family HTH domain
MSIELTKARAQLLQDLRRQKGFDFDEAVCGTGVNPVAFRRWEEGKVNSIRESNLKRVLARFGLTLPEFLAATDEPSVHDRVKISALETSRSARLAELLAMSGEIDRISMSVLQSASASLENKEIYKSLLYGGLVRRGFSVGEFSNSIRRIATHGCDPRVTLELDAQLRRLNIKIGSEGVLEINDPRLLWDCSCLPEQLCAVLRCRGYKPQPCRIHSHSRGNELMDLTSREFVELRYRNTKILWRQSRQLWPPSIDTVLTLRNLQAVGVIQSGTESVLDLGCGTGMLGICIARQNHSVHRLGLADWLLTPLLHAALNANHNLNSLPVQARLHLGLFEDWVTEGLGERYDVLVSTPPYLPVADGFSQVRAESPVAGTELINFIVRTAIARVGYITISSLVEADIKKLANDQDVKMEPIGTSLQVPFRVPAALRCPSYVMCLIDTKRLEFRPGNRYPLRHKITTFRIFWPERTC